MELPYDIYVNSSLTNEHYVKLKPIGEILTDEDVELIKDRYMTIYVNEEHRNSYLKSLYLNDKLTTVEKGDEIKNSSIKYLDEIFKNKEKTNVVLKKTLDNCHEATQSLVLLIKDFNLNAVQDLISKLSFHDFYTYDHSINVAMYNIMQYKSIKKNASEDELVVAGLSGMLHDLGKVKLSTSIINKSEKLTDEEFNEIKKHPQYGKDMICDICCNGDINLDEVAKVIYEHHENFNGTGYPNKIIGNDISLLARITAISDFYDAVTTKRSYHEALSTNDALLLMNKSVGVKLDPLLFKNFVKQISKMLNLETPFSLDVPDDFDPCQPQKKVFKYKLSLINSNKKKIEKTGQVKFVDEYNEVSKDKKIKIS